MKRIAMIIAMSSSVITLSPPTFAAKENNSSTLVPAIVPEISAAQLDNASIEDLKKIILALSDRVDSMETNTTERRSIATAKPIIPWTEKIQWHGDFRYRFENIDNDQTDEDRHRSRIRARLGLTAQVTDDVKAGITLASGNEDPLSSNQTLGGGGTSKGINLDMAFIDWQFAKNFNLVAGKTKNPFYSVAKNDLIWDSDYRPEGANISFDNGTFWAVAGYHFLESDNKGGAQDVEEMFGAQLGYNGKISDRTNFKVGVSYFYIPVAGSDFFGNGESFGNTELGISGSYQYNYKTTELFVELNTKIAGVKSTFFADYVKNSDADEDTGFSLGFKLGSVKNKGDWQFGYSYQDLEADAIFAALTDADFGGGGTDVKGHKFNTAYTFSKNTSLSITYLDNKYGMHTRTEKLDFDRLQVDVVTKF